MRIPLLLAAIFLAHLAVPALAHQEMLEGSEWGVVGEEGPKARFVSFAGSDRIFGFGGCNRFSGTYTQHDEHLTISPLAATRMACEPVIMKKEQEFFDMLAKVRGVRVDHTLLLFLDETGADLKALSRRNAGSSGSEE
jgi:heat shock protein HslJ